MKLDKEKFNKLKQLDRIEYRQKYNKIEKANFGGEILIFLSFVTMIIGVVFGVGSKLSEQITGKINFGLFGGFIDFMNFSLVLLILGAILLLITDYVKSNLKEKLEQEYFKMEIKK